MKISGVVITFNEEKNIARCLTSLNQVCDEVIVVDSLSTDRTVEICKQLGAQVTHQKFLGYIEQKNFALSLAANEFVLSLDGDEELSAPLIKKIKELKKNQKQDIDGFFFPRLTRYVDVWVRHCGWYPDLKLRLARKSMARWSGVNPHDKLELLPDAKTQKIPFDILHYSYSSVSSHIIQTERFTTIAALAHFNSGKRSSVFNIVTRPPLKFVRDYFYKRGFMMGYYGFIICVINALSAFLKYTKIYELQRGKDIKDIG